MTRSRLFWLAPIAGVLLGCSESEPEGETLPHQEIDLPSVAACGACHQTALQEWQLNLHSRAWDNSNVQTATNDFAKEECRSCHSPRAVLITGLDREAEYRDVNQLDGVHCLSCHGLPDGVAATRTIPDAPCRPRFDPRLSSDALCFPCHEPRQGTLSEFHRSDAHALGIQCIDCHMPRRSDRPGRSHGPFGGTNELFVRRAIEWDCEIRDGAVHVRVENRTSHRFPGEISLRAFVVRVDFPGGQRAYETMRRPADLEERPDNRLEPDETREIVFEMPEGAGSARVLLLFKSFPLMPDDAAFLLGRWP